MRKGQKVAVLAMSAVLLVSASIMGTMAYLQDQETATNTFTVGKVGLTLDEADVNPDGTLKTESRVTENEYHLLPGHSYLKDPTVTIEDDSEDAYVRMMVKVVGLDSLEAVFSSEKYYADGVFLLQSLTPDWNSECWNYYDFDSTNDTYEFRYYKKVESSKDADSDGIKLEPLFEHIVVPGEDVTNDSIGNLKDVKIIVTAHAIQADGFDSAEDAWGKFK